MSKLINFTKVNPLSKKEDFKIKNEIFASVQNNDFILGKAVNIFENQFSKFSKNKYSVSCASGTDALILSLMVLGLKKDDEVIVPGLTYVSTGFSVLLNNNKLVLVDIDNDTGLLAIEKIKKKITTNTKAIIPVNLYGQKIDLLTLRKAVGKKIYIIEDSAQSHFAFNCNNCSRFSINKCCKKLRRENYADISCYSFYPAKNLGAYGDGGLMTTNKMKIYKKLLALRNLGSTKKHQHLLLGKNSRLDTIQAIVLKNKLKSVFKLNEKRRKIAQFYDENLKKIKQITLTKTNQGSSRHLYVIRTKERDNLINYLSKKKILCQIHYPYSLNGLIPVRKKIKKIYLKNSEKWAKECMSLPMHPNLLKNEIYRIVNEIENYFEYK